jgi:uncharacterized protein (TIGR01777 family)
VVARTGLLLSNQGGAFPPLRLIGSLGAGGPMGSGKQYWPWLHFDDEIAALRRLLDSNASGPYNLCSPNPLPEAEFFKVLGKVMHRPAFIPTPAFALRLMAGELADALLLTGQREMPARLQKLGYTFKYTELEPALRSLVS